MAVLLAVIVRGPCAVGSQRSFGIGRRAVIDAKLPAGSGCLDEVTRLRAGLTMAEAVSTSSAFIQGALRTE